MSGGRLYWGEVPLGAWLFRFTPINQSASQYICDETESKAEDIGKIRTRATSALRMRM